MRSLRDAQSGSVAVLTALGFTVLLGAAALGMDYGAMIVAKRRAQGAVDLAAMLAAANPLQADSVARRSLADNGYTVSSAIRVESGAYAADSKVPVEARFSAGQTPASAVRVSLLASTPTYFMPALGLNRDVAVGVTGTAASAQFAAFTIGSGLAALDAGIANAVLGAMLGRQVSLSVMDYQALVSLRVDSFRALDALASTLNLQVGTYTDLMDLTATAGQITSALQLAAKSVDNSSTAVAALGQIVSALRGGGGSVRIGQVFDLGDAAALAPGLGTRGPAIGLMDALSETVSLANGKRQVSVDLGASIPGLLRTQVTLAIGERAQSSGYVQPGSRNATATTAQIRVLIEAGLQLPLGLGGVTIPVYAQAARGRGTLRSMTCPWSATSRRQVVVEAQPGLVDLAVAAIPKEFVDPAAQTPDLTQPVALLRVAPALTVLARGRVTLGSAYAQSLTFSDDDITRHTIRTVSSTGMTRAMVGSLFQSLILEPKGIGVIAPGLVTGALSTSLDLAAPAIDGVLDTTLRTLGIRLGNVDVSVDGTRCDQAVLVQ